MVERDAAANAGDACWEAGMSGSITINRVTVNAEHDNSYISIVIRNETERILHVRLGLAEFAAALTGQAEVVCGIQQHGVYSQEVKYDPN